MLPITLDDRTSITVLGGLRDTLEALYLFILHKAGEIPSPTRSSNQQDSTETPLPSREFLRFNIAYLTQKLIEAVERHGYHGWGERRVEAFVEATASQLLQESEEGGAHALL